MKTPMSFTAIVASICCAGTGQQALAQDTPSEVEISAGTPANPEVNNGTNPTLLANTFEFKTGYIDAGNGFDAWSTETSLTLPFGKKNVAFRFTAPVSQSVIDNTFDLGDISATFIHVVDVNRKRGIAYTVELFTDTASRPDLGYGEAAVELSAFYAWFLKNGSIFAPAVVQTIGLGTPPGGKSVSQTTVDFYYVPKLKNPKLFMTFDPAIIRDWRAKDTFGSLQVTFGSSIGKIGKGNWAIYARPQILIGAKRPANWGFEIGTKVIGF